MAVWIELHCDGKGFNGLCLSNQGASPSVLAGHTERELREAMGILVAKATERGWVRARRKSTEWRCPRCQAARAATVPSLDLNDIDNAAQR